MFVYLCFFVFLLQFLSAPTARLVYNYLIIPTHEEPYGHLSLDLIYIDVV